VGVLPVSTITNRGSGASFFAATILRQDGVARIELRHGDTVLDTYRAGGAAPVVSVGSPTGGSYSSGSIPVTWAAADADGDPLRITIAYSADGGATWVPVAFSQGSGTVAVPVSQLAGSSNARFQVTASDGLHRGSATSAAFTVAPSRPSRTLGSLPRAAASQRASRSTWWAGRVTTRDALWPTPGCAGEATATGTSGRGPTGGRS